MKVKCGYRYRLELYKKAPDLALGCMYLDRIDWEPAYNCGELLGIRRGKLSPRLDQGNAVVDPLWLPQQGAPYLKGFRLRIFSDGNGDAFVCDFPITYFSDWAHKASQHYVKEGKLQVGDEFYYLVTAFPAEPAACVDGLNSGGLSVKNLSTALPLTRSSLPRLKSASKAAGSLADDPDDVPVFVHPEVLEEASRRTREAGAKEAGGILIGYLHRDRSSTEIMVEVTAEVPAEQAHSELYSLTFTPETWTAARAALDLRRRGEIMLGWWHSHSYQKELCKDCRHVKEGTCGHTAVFMSEKDCAVQRAAFSRAYCVALVLGDTPCHGLNCGLFGWRQGVLHHRAFRVVDKDRTETFRNHKS